jgi:hypothetical protein
MGHRCAYEIKYAVENAGSLDIEKLRSAYMDLRFDSVDGPVHYGSPYGTTAYYPVPVSRIKNGKIEMTGLFNPDKVSQSDIEMLR